MKKLFNLFFTFFKIGLFTFGGGYAMISQIKETVVEKNKWITEDELVEIIAIAEATPGPIAINMATFIGYKKKGFFGSAMATVGAVLPSFIIIFIISLFAEAFKQIKLVEYAFAGIKAAVAFLIFKTGISMLLKMERKVYPIISFSIVLLSMVLFEIFAISFSAVYFILLGGVIGICLCAVSNKALKGDKK